MCQDKTSKQSKGAVKIFVVSRHFSSHMEGDSSKGINPLIQSPEGEVSTVSHPLSSLPPMRHKKNHQSTFALSINSSPDTSFEITPYEGY